MAAARIQRWALFLANYSYTVQYRKGSEHSNADALSRLPLAITEPRENYSDEREYVLFAQAMEETAICTREVKQMTDRDTTLQHVKEWILEGWPRFRPQDHEQYRPYFNRSTELTVSDNLVYWGHRIVMPFAARRRAINLLHETHPGMVSMKSIARTLFWYPGLDSDIERLVSSCYVCAQASAMPPAQVPATWPATGERWSRLHADFAGPVDGHMVLVIVDSETKWIEAVPMKIATSETTVRALRSIFARFGLPKTFVSDNGPQFVSAFFREFLARNKVQQLTTAPYHPQSNGLAERAVRTLKEGLKKNPGNDLITRLDRFLCRYRRTPGEDGKSPAERLLGYQIRTKIDAIKPKEKYADGLPAAATRKFNAGDPVWMRSFGRSRRWIPGVVQDQQGSRMVTVDCAQGRHRRHLDQLRRRAESMDSDLDQTSKQELSEDTGERVQDSPEETVAESATPPLLRRSTRPRKPPERYGF